MACALLSNIEPFPLPEGKIDRQGTNGGINA